VQRNKIGVATAAFVALTLVGGIVATTWEAHVARQERARAKGVSMMCVNSRIRSFSI
jgi:hypothetical protein